MSDQTFTADELAAATEGEPTHAYRNLTPVGTEVTYRNDDPTSMRHDMNGVRGVVAKHITEPDDRHDEECLPMILLHLDTSQGHGEYFEVWPEEIEVAS